MILATGSWPTKKPDWIGAKQSYTPAWEKVLHGSSFVDGSAEQKQKKMDANNTKQSCFNTALRQIKRISDWKCDWRFFEHLMLWRSGVKSMLNLIPPEPTPWRASPEIKQPQWTWLFLCMRLINLRSVTVLNDGSHDCEVHISVSPL